MKIKFNLEVPSTIKTSASSIVQISSETLSAISPIHISGEIECSVSEMKEMWELEKEMLKDGPELLDVFAEKVMTIAEKFKVREQQGVAQNDCCAKDEIK